MPPKKGRATAKAVATSADTPRQTRGKQPDAPTSAASTRAKRDTAVGAPAKPLLREKRTVHHYKPEQTDNIVEVETPVAAPKRGRGRPPVKRHDEALVSEVEEHDATDEKPAPKKRGRPAKKVQEEVTQPEEEVDELVEPTPKRGRGRLSLQKVTDAVEEPEKPEEVDEIVEPTPKRGRGRPSLSKPQEKASAPEEVDENEEKPAAKRAAGRPSRNVSKNETPKRRGRPSKAAEAEEVREEAEFDDADNEDGAAEEAGQTEPATKKKGRPSKAAKAEEVREEADFDDADSNDDEEKQASEQQPVPKKRGRPAKNKADDAPANDEAEEPPAKRGRKAKTESKQEEPEEPAKKRGRPAKRQQEEPVEDPAPKKRGRPARAATQVAPEPKSLPESKKRGRPARAAAEPASEPETAPPSKKRGRPAKATTEVASKSQPTEAPTKRGRPAKAAVSTSKAAPKKRGRPAKVAVDGAVGEEDETEAEPATKKRARGRPAKVSATKKGGKGKAVANVDDDDDEEADTSNEINPTEATTEIAPSEASGRQYWLMKAEPETRLEKTESGKTVDVRFSIDDLAAKSSPEPWDGIRNAVASNNMRAMNPGDLAFFYESNCKVPGIVGTMEIVKEADVDVSAFDKESAYYDAKSKIDKPRWMNAYVEFRSKFDKISLKDLQSHGQKGGALEGMDLLRLSRLSVSKVSASQWAFIMSLIDGAEDESTITVAGASGSSKKAQTQPSKQPQSPGLTLTAQLVNTSGPEPADEAEEADFASAFEAPATLSSSPVKNAASYIGGIVEEIVEDTVDVAEAAVTSVAAGLAHNLGDQRDIDMVDVRHEHHHHHKRGHSLGNNGDGEIETVHKDASVASPSLADREEASGNDGNGTFDAIEFSSIKTRTPAPEDNHSHGLLDTLKSTIGLSSDTPGKNQGSKTGSEAGSTAPTSAVAKVKDAVIAAAGSLEENVMEPGRERSKTQTSTQTAGEDTFVTADGLGDAEAGARSNGLEFDFTLGDESELGNGNENGDGDDAGVDGALARPLSYS